MPSPSPQEKVEVEVERCENCGQPFAYVWWCHDPALWEAVTGNKRQPGSLEHAPGLWCIPCFDAACLEKGVGFVEWAPLNIRHLSFKGPGRSGASGNSGPTNAIARVRRIAAEYGAALKDPHP